MSVVAINDENQGVCPGGKISSSSDDIFALEQPTGRPSILRQTENLPSKTVAKSSKVCFQTPIRDPVTRRILPQSPTKSDKMAILDECTKAMETLQLENTNILPQESQSFNGQKTDQSSYPDDEMPIQSKGGYQFDLDNIDAINPFQGSNKIVLSPPRPAVKDLSTGENEPAHSQPKDIPEDLTQTDPVLDETLSFHASVNNSLADTSTDSSVVTVMKHPAVEEEEEENVFTVLPDEEPPAAMSLSTNHDGASASFSLEDAPLSLKGAYNLDYDNLDSINPFQTGSSKIQNSPVVRKNVTHNDQPIEASGFEQIQPENTVDIPLAIQKAPVEPEIKPIATVAPISSDATKPMNVESMPQPVVSPLKEGPVRLEFNFDDGAEVKRKPPPRMLGKRPPGLKSTQKNPVYEKESVPPKQSPAKTHNDDDVVAVPKASYSFDFEKFDDPNFNPFGSNSNVNTSSSCGIEFSPAGKAPTPLQEIKEMANPEPMSVENESVLPTCSAGDSPAKTDSSPSTNEVCQEEPKTVSGHDLECQPESEQRVLSPPDCSEVSEQQQKSQCVQLDATQEFVPGATFMADNFDGQIDYLEQFGSSSFKESALRKQSLYLKFDPLLRESPKKSAGMAVHNHLPHLSTFASRLDATQMAEKQHVNKPEKEYFKLLDIAGPPLVAPFSQNPPMLDALAPSFPQPANTEDAIIDVLKYSQKDMDEAIAKVQAESKEKEDQLNAKYDQLHEEGQEIRKLISEFEVTIEKLVADKEKERQAAQVKLIEVLQEKEQVSTDLNGMERSFSELFKRLEKYKVVIEGYKKNEETLKKCAQEYLARNKREEERYRALKAHAQEKITRANEEIAEVRSKLSSEASALEAQLRLEQFKVQSLEKNLNQKVKEAEELAKLCDELIAKVQKG